ncbi:MAG TPA: TRAP transporter substrate-binding protein [Beijerinckiaceae bacterium]|jgi:TRAP-type C4-dicarboxylate transport system substrate-binding protein
MKLTRRDFAAAAGGLIAAPAVLRSGGARAQDSVTLRFHHFLPAVSNVHRRLIAPWAKKVEDMSSGKLKVQVFPAMQLGGTPPQLYDQAKDGVVDIVWTLPGATPGRFPSAEVFELPFIADPRGVVNARAAQEFGQTHLADETKDVKLLCYWCHDGGVIHSTRKMEKLEDLKGLKLRFPSRMTGEALKVAGVTAIGMPVTQVPESVSQRVLDGAVVAWEVVPSIKLAELARNHMEIPGAPTLYSAAFFIAMNKAKYESLPADLRKIIDDTMGMAFATDAGKMWDEAGAEVKEAVRKRGNTITQLSEADRVAWMKACEPVTAKWIEDQKARGLDGAKQIADAKALLAKYAKS